MWKVAFRMLGHPGRHSNAFLIPTASLGEHCLASALQVPLHLGDWCLDSVFSMKHLCMLSDGLASPRGQHRQQSVAMAGHRSLSLQASLAESLLIC